MQDESGAAPPGEATPVVEERKEPALAGHLPEQRRDEQSEEPRSGPQDFVAPALPRAVLEAERRGIGAAVPR